MLATGKFRCHKCNKTFTSFAKVGQHYRNVHASKTQRRIKVPGKRLL